MKLPRNSESRSKSRQKCLQVQKSGIGLSRSQPRQLTQSSPSAASPRCFLRSYQEHPVHRRGRRSAQNCQRQRAKRSDGGGTDSSRSMTRCRRCSPDAVTCHHCGRWETSGGAGEPTPTDRPHPSESSSADSPREETEGLWGSFQVALPETEGKCSPVPQEPTSDFSYSPTLLSGSPSSSHSPEACCRLAPPSTGEQRGQGVANARTLRWPWDRTPICCPCRLGCTEHALVETTDTTLWPTKVLEWLVCRREARSKIKTQWPRLHLPAEIGNWKSSQSSTVTCECKALCLVNLSTTQMVDNIK